MGVKFTPENVNDIVAYAEDLGLTRGALGNAMLAHPILRSAEVQKMMADAAAYRRLTLAPAKAAPKDLPPVVRPGVSGPRVSSGQRSLDALQQKAVGLKGDAQVKAFAAIIAARRRAS